MLTKNCIWGPVGARPLTGGMVPAASFRPRTACVGLSITLVDYDHIMHTKKMKIGTG